MKKGLGLFLAIIMMVSFLAGCAPKQEEVKEVDLNEIHTAVKESLGEDGYYPDRELSLEEIEDMTGIKESDIKSYIAEAPMMNLSVDTFIAIEANEGKADAIQAGLEEFRTYLVEESFQYPMNMPKVNSAKVVRHGDYVFFIMLGGIDPNANNQDTTEEEMLEFAKGEIQKVEEAINKFFE